MSPLVDAPVAPMEIEQLDPEEVTPCSDSRHPAHIKCGEPAVYVIIPTCAACELRLRYVCSEHCQELLRAYINNGVWCVCSPYHSWPHAITSVRLKGL